MAENLTSEIAARIEFEHVEIIRRLCLSVVKEMLKKEMLRKERATLRLSEMKLQIKNG